MDSMIRIRRAPGTWVVRTGDALLGETRAALELTERDMPPVIFFPREDVAMALLDLTTARSSRPLIGEGQHFAIQTPDQRLMDAVWSCDKPETGAERIAGYLSFARHLTTVELI